MVLMGVFAPHNELPIPSIWLLGSIILFCTMLICGGDYMILSKGYQSALNWPICYSRFAFFLVARWQTGLYFMILDFVFIDRETMIVCFSLLCFVCTLCWFSLFYYLACSKVNMYITFCDKPLYMTFLYIILFYKTWLQSMCDIGIP